MRPIKSVAGVALVWLFAGAASAAIAQQSSSAPAATAPPTAEATAAAPAARTPCASLQAVFASDCPLSWHGVTLYGAYDIGAGWVSHGVPTSGFNYEGESLVNRNGNRSQFLIEPNNLSQTGFGLRVKEEFSPGWSVVFNASTGFNPQSFDVANQGATNTFNNGRPRASYYFAGDGPRAGQIFNDVLYGGLSSTMLGTLTFGRQRALGVDAMLAYDPAGGAYAFSFIGYNGLMAGGGDTQNARLDNALKYRVGQGPFHFGALYKFADGQGGCFSGAASWTAATCRPEAPHNTAYGLDFGGAYRGFSADVVVQHVNQAISVVNPLLGSTSPTQPYQATTDSIDTNPISGGNLIGINNTEYGIVTDNTAAMVAAKYVLNKFRFYGGYEYIRQTNPTNPLGIGATAQGGYRLSGVEDDNLDSPKIVQVFWTGVKYAYDARTDVTLSYYREWQNNFRLPPTCSAAAGFRSSCAGALDELSLYADHRLTGRVDVYAGVAYSDVSGGLAIAIPHGPGVPYYFNDNIAPTVGARFAF